MNVEQLKELIEQIDASSLRVFEMDNEFVSLKMSKNEETTFSSAASNGQAETAQVKTVEATAPNPVPSQTVETPQAEETSLPEDDLHKVTAPIVGTAYLAPSPDQEPFVKVGDTVQKGDPLLIVEAMKVMNEIKADASGEIAEILVEDGQPIEFGQALIKIKN